MFLILNAQVVNYFDKVHDKLPKDVVMECV